ncbi:MAG: hypothetical protein ACRES2_03560 [Steroidobacteraceae bacterium]
MKRHVFLLTTLAVAFSSGAASPPDPWTLVPPLPTGCYQDQDGFAGAADKVITRLNGDIDRQRQVNDELTQRARNVDPMVKQQAMMNYLMQHPQDAQKMMQGMQAAAPQVMPALQAETSQDKAFDDLKSHYEIARQAARAGITFTGKPVQTEAGPEWSESDTASVNKRIDERYDKSCPEWFGSGAFARHLAGYKNVLVGDLPRQETTADFSRQQLVIAGVAPDNYRSTAPLEAARKYLVRAQDSYGRRAQSHSKTDRMGMVHGGP